MMPILFNIPFVGWPIYSYGLMMVVGFLASIQLGKYLARRCGFDPEIFVNVGLIALITGVLIIFQSVGWIDRTGRLPLSFFPPGVLALFAALVFGYDLSRGAISRRRKRARR